MGKQPRLALDERVDAAERGRSVARSARAEHADRTDDFSA